MIRCGRENPQRAASNTTGLLQSPSGLLPTVRPTVYEIGLTHTIDAAHRVVGHEHGKGKCARLHGHTYGFDVSVAASELEPIGFVVDFAQIKTLLNDWDHRTLLWERDPIAEALEAADFGSSIVRLPFNPTAENLSRDVAERALELAPSAAWVEVVCRETAKSMARWRAER